MKTVTVKRGDTLWAISQRTGISVNDIKEYNNLTSNNLQIGQVLNLESSRPEPALPPGVPVWYYPVLPWNRYNNNAGRFLDPVYYSQLGAVHPGVDLNGNGGGNTDFGDSVYAACSGVVVDARWYPVWGYIIKIWHPYDKVWTIYAHCNKIFVSKGQTVVGGQRIGTIGTGEGGRYLAHLHFEIRKTDMPSDIWPSGRYPNRWQAETFVRSNYLAPLTFLQLKNARRVL